jgi:hypothetical protein
LAAGTYTIETALVEHVDRHDGDGALGSTRRAVHVDSAMTELA